MRKKIGHFLIVNPFIYAFIITSLKLNMAPGVLLEPYVSKGVHGVAETPIVSKGLILMRNMIVCMHLTLILMTIKPTMSVILSVPSNCDIFAIFAMIASVNIHFGTPLY